MPINGFLNLNKPSGPTSNDMVEEMRRLLGTRGGHAGTLDPLARGVLVLGMGEARKFIPYLDHGKEYEAVMRLGQESTTLDLGGELSPPRAVEATEEEIRAVGAALTGELELPVPAYSAVHVDGKRLYELARAGTAVELPLRKCTVHRMEIVSVEPPLVRFRLACSGGTYVRSIAAEWGKRLGCGALLAELVRTKSGAFTIAESRTPEEVRALAESGAGADALVPLERGLAGLPPVGFDEADTCLLRHGRHVPLRGPAVEAGAAALLKGQGGAFIGVGRAFIDPAGTPCIKPERLLAEEASPA